MSNRNYWLPALLAGIALVGGIAWAAQSETIALPATSSFSVRAEIVPGDGGDIVYKVRGENFSDIEDLNIGFEPDDDLVVFGNVVATYEPDHVHVVTMAFYQTPEGWRCDVLVEDLDDCSILHEEFEHEFGEDVPGSCTATAQTVIDLTAE